MGLSTRNIFLSISHAVELKKQKEVMEAAEKLRREKWIQEKTMQIKVRNDQKTVFKK